MSEETPQTGPVQDETQTEETPEGSEGSEESNEELDVSGDPIIDDIEDVFGEEDVEDEEDEEDEEVDPNEDLEEGKEEDEFDPLEELTKVIEAPEEEEEEAPSIGDDVTDEAIADAMWQVDSYASWMKTGKENEHPVDDKFAALVARNQIDPSYLAERNIFSMDDYNTYVAGLEERVDPEAIYLPSTDNEEELAEFNYRHYDFPRTTEDYVDEVFQDTFLEEDKEVHEDLKMWAYNNQFTNAQLSAVLDKMGEENELAISNSEQAIQEFKETQEKLMMDDYGEDLRGFVKQGQKVLSTFDPDGSLRKEFGGDKTLKSKAFLDFLTRIADSGTKLNSVDFGGRTLRTLSDAKLSEFKKQVYSREEFKSDKRTSPDAKERKGYKVWAARLERINNEMARRGLE